jgi:peroxiredoxin
MARDMAELLATLQAEPRSESALEAATWILLNTPDGPEVEQAASVITNQHLMNTNLLVLCDGLERMRPRCATNLLSALMSGNPEAEIRGRACWTLAGLWKDAADYGRNQAAAVMAEKLYERVLREFGQLKCPKNAKPGARTLADLAEPELSELRRLGIGKTAPNIQGFDLEGQPMSLADYRGRVVLLVFWISGCSEAPHLRKLLEELEGKPFVVLGVNCDNKREKAQADIDKYGITWRSFWDKRNGPIAQQWNVTSWADFWVIDADGVIRVRGWNEHYFGLKKLLGLE